MEPRFFHRSDVRRVLERAHRAAGVPVSVHYVARNEESPRTAGWGGCAACRTVAAMAGGGRACRLSRVTAASMALRQQRPLVFICHMGFACVSVPAVPGENFVLTFGPYYTGPEERGLTHAVLGGLEALTGTRPGELPVSLEDIHRTNADSVPAVAQWTMESLAACYAGYLSSEAPPGPENEETVSSAPARGRRRAPAPDPAADVALALAGGNLRQVRSLLSDMLAEADFGRGAEVEQRRAWAAATVTAVLHACTRAGMSVGAAWETFGKAMEDAGAAEADRDMLSAMVRVLRRVEAMLTESGPKQQKRPRARRAAYHALNRIVEERLAEGVPLSEAAARLGVSPSVLSKRLDRQFGMNYTEYVNRLRVKRAKELLRRTRCTASEAARRVGVCDQSYFSKLFVRFEGVTPTEYRARFSKKK